MTRTIVLRQGDVRMIRIETREGSAALLIFDDPYEPPLIEARLDAEEADEIVVVLGGVPGA